MQKQHKYIVGQNLDVLDSVKRWCNAEVIRVAGPEMYIYYTGWSSKYNQWIPYDSDRILTQWEPGKQIHINNRLDVKHPLPRQWLQARVIQISQQNKSSVKVHFNNFHAKYDIWIDLNNQEQTAIIGSYSKAHGSGKRRRKQAFKISQEVLNRLKNAHEQFKQSLNNKNLVIKPVVGDGNCLFRTVSDQLYGTEQHHEKIRQIVMDYIIEERYFFQNYVLGDIEQYVQMKRNLGAWGDDVELQAISEIYNRPIEVYVNDNKPLRTFHEDNDGNVYPLRVAYQGSCHYNSIKQIGYQNMGIMQDKFPVWQTLFMDHVRNKKNNGANNIDQNNYYDNNNNVYRNQFANRSTIDQTLNDILNNQFKQTNTEVQNEMLKMTQTNSLLDQIEQAQIKQAQLNDEKNRIDQQMRRIEQLELQQIKKQSLKQQQQKMRSAFTIQEQYWIQGIRDQGFSDDQIMFAISIKGRNPDEVVNYLYDNM